MDDRRRTDERAAEQGGPADKARWLEQVYRSTGSEQEVAKALACISAQLRSEVLSMTRIETPRQNVVKIMALMFEQVDYALETALLFGQQAGDCPFPSREGVLNSIMLELDPWTAEKILKFQQPTLLIVPDTSGDRSIQALQSKPCNPAGNHSAPEISDFAAAFMRWLHGKGDEIESWNFAIVEGSPSPVAPWDVTSENVGLRIARFDRHFMFSKIHRVNSPSYMCLVMQNLRKGTPIDIGKTLFLHGTDPQGGFDFGDHAEGLAAVATWDAVGHLLRFNEISFELPSGLNSLFRGAFTGSIRAPLPPATPSPESGNLFDW